MSQAAKANEPSMEEILASIRKIIADDEQPKAEAKPAEVKAEPAEDPGQSQDDIDALLASFDSVDEEEVIAPPPPPPPVAKKKAAPPPPPPPPVVEPDVFDLTEAVELPTPNIDLDFEDVVEAPPPPPPKPRPAPPAPVMRAPPEAPLLSTDAVRSIGASFDSLGALAFASGGTVEGLVKEMLRPILKEWLDQNLPPLVERLVKAEIERARGGR